jgi:catechol 2,3-dioxygenase-like lactoylglutathione lyase family enzyme
MKIIELAFTAYPVTDLKRAEKFYAGTLGLRESRRWGDENKAWVPACATFPSQSD